MNHAKALQDYFPGNTCFGCGPSNPLGLHLKTHLASPISGETITTVTHTVPRRFLQAGFHKTLHGGTVCTLLDCPLVFTALADDARRKNWSFEDGFCPPYWYVAETFENIRIKKPVPIDKPLTVRAQVKQRGKKSRLVVGSLYLEENLVAEGTIICVNVPLSERSKQWLLTPRTCFYRDMLREQPLIAYQWREVIHDDLALVD